MVLWAVMMRDFGSSLSARCAALALTLVVSGCHSPWIQCTIVNHEETAVSLVEVSYPGGSFGVQTITAGGSYHYRFRNLSTDTVRIDFTDAARHNHTVSGPQLEQGQEGSLRIELEPGDRVTWTPALTAKK